MKKYINFFKKYWITIWLAAAIIALCGGLVYAKYGAEHNVVKRVIATDSGAENRFTSNYLATGSSNQHIRSISSTSTDDIVYDINIYNYSINKPTQWYPTDLEYTLSAQIKTLDGTTTINGTQVDGLIGNDQIILYTVSYDENIQEVTAPLLTLDKDNLIVSNSSQVITNSSGGGTYNSYRLILPNSMVGKNISVVITATPASKHRDIADIVLSSRFCAEIQTIVLSTGWVGAFNDDTSVSLSTYEGFNYSITGSGNSSGKLSWRYDLLEPNLNEISTLFGVDLSNSSNYTDNTTTKMRTITLSSLSSDNNAGRYDFQLYIKDAGAKSAIETLNNWTTFSTYCVFEEDE